MDNILELEEWRTAVEIIDELLLDETFDDSFKEEYLKQVLKLFGIPEVEHPWFIASNSLRDVTTYLFLSENLRASVMLAMVLLVKSKRFRIEALNKDSTE